jgi:alpha-aminoadipate/glutamate carrier protein LysW
MATTCPVCDAVIEIDEDEIDEGDSITCDECGADLRVAGVDPLELQSLEEEDEDEEPADFDEDEEEEEEEEDENWK